MQAKIYNNFIVFLLICFSVCRADQGDELYKKYLNTIMTGYFPEQNDLSWVTPDIKQAITQKAEAAYNSPDPTTHSNALEALIILGDQPTIESYIADYHQGKTEVMPSVQVLPYLIDDVYNGDSVRKSNLDASIMDKSTHTIYQVLKSYPNFPPDTRKWARSAMGRLDGGGPNSPAVQMLRAWWEHNKDAVLAHKYGDAKWLPAPQNPVPPSLPIFSQPSASGAANATPQAPQSQPAVEISLPWWGYAIIMLSLSAVGGLWYFLRPKKSELHKPTLAPELPKKNNR